MVVAEVASAANHQDHTGSSLVWRETMIDATPHPFRLQVLGTPDLRAPDGRRVASILSQPKRLGLLTYLALSPAPVSRGSLVAMFWPESDEARARNALSQALHHLRRSLGDDLVLGVEGDRLWIPRERLWCDAREVLCDAEPSLALVRAAGPDLLEGWNADDSQPLQEWLDAQRRKIHDRVARLAPREGVEARIGEPRGSDLDRRVIAVVSTGPIRRVLATVSAVSRKLAAEYAISVTVAAISLVAVSALGVVGIELAATRFSGASVEEMAVLLPRVMAAPGVADLSPQAVLDEVLAQLPDRATLRVIPTQSATSVSDFRRQLSAIGVTEAGSPDWILEVSIRVTTNEARVVGLLYRSPAFDLPGRESFDVSYAGAESVLLDVPQEIGRGVGAMVGRALAADAASGP